MAIKFICMAKVCSIWRDESTRSWAWCRSWLWRDILAIVCRLSAPHGDEQQYDHQEPAEKFRVDGGLDPRDPAHQQPQGRAGQKAVGNSFTETQR